MTETNQQPYAAHSTERRLNCELSQKICDPLKSRARSLHNSKVGCQENFSALNPAPHLPIPDLYTEIREEFSISQMLI